MLIPASIRPAAGTALAAAWLIGTLHAAPTGTNLDFESGLTGWASANVTIVTATTKVYAGTKSLSLRNGHIQQTFTGLVPGALNTLSLAYRDNTTESWLLSDARILIDGAVIGEIHNGQKNEYLHSGGFEFVANAATATLRIESLDPGPQGLLLDHIRIAAGGLEPPPEHVWNTLAAIPDPRGGRQLANGGFESATSNPASDPDNSGPADGPHLCGLSLPGWLVTRENVDIIRDSANAPEGSNALDTSGHGPGGIAQTITGLQPGAVHTLSFRYARHADWGSADMTGEVFSNGRLVASLVRTIDQTWNNGYDLKEIPVLASAEGTLTVEIRSTTIDQGGNIIYDDIRLKQGGDGFLAWALHHGVTADNGADDDGDTLSHGFEFLFGSDPRSPTALPLVQAGMLHVPLSGLALSQGYTHTLETSRTLTSWQSATSPASGISLVSDTASPGTNGERIYAIHPAEPKLFWKHVLGLP